MNNEIKKVSLSDTFAVSKTSCSMNGYGTNEPCGVVFHGYTIDSRQWEAAKKSIQGRPKEQKLILGKRENYMAITPDEEAELNQNLVLIEVITDITGIEGYVFDRKDARERLLDPEQWKYWLDQWKDHLDDRANFTKPQNPMQRAGLAA